MNAATSPGANRTTPHIPILGLGLSLGVFFALSFLACLALGLVVPEGGMHRPWLQFFPGFEWITPRGVALGLVWTQFYAWWTAIVFGTAYNTLAPRFG